MLWTLIPAGEFLMGSDDGRDDERPRHRVYVDAFEMAVYPVTEAEYAEFLESTRHERPEGGLAIGRRDPEGLPSPALPVVGVSWLDAQAYCAWRAGRGEPMRLPTEAEWERAARGGREGERYPWGDEIPGWIPDAGHGPLEAPWPVMLGEPNAFGLYGIGANIHEWCGDWYDPAYYERSPARNPPGPPTGTRRASRGGAWRHAITISRTAARSRIDPSFRYTDYGFRAVRA